MKTPTECVQWRDEKIQQLREQLAAHKLLVKQLEQDVEAKERRCNETYQHLAAATEDKRVVMHAHAVYQDNTNLKQQLAAAQAARVKLGQVLEQVEIPFNLHDEIRQLLSGDTTALEAYAEAAKEEVRKEWSHSESQRNLMSKMKIAEIEEFKREQMQPLVDALVPLMREDGHYFECPAPTQQTHDTMPNCKTVQHCKRLQAALARIGEK